MIPSTLGMGDKLIGSKQKRDRAFISLSYRLNLQVLLNFILSSVNVGLILNREGRNSLTNLYIMGDPVEIAAWIGMISFTYQEISNAHCCGND
jgi:hypothetical protein